MASPYACVVTTSCWRARLGASSYSLARVYCLIKCGGGGAHCLGLENPSLRGQCMHSK